MSLFFFSLSRVSVKPHELLSLLFIHVRALWPVALLLTALLTEGIREMLC